MVTTETLTDSALQPSSDLREQVIAAIITVFDPEIPVNIYDLGLIYQIDIDKDHVDIQMTLTTPACPVAGELPQQVQTAVEMVEGVGSAKVDLVWDPPWDRSRMSEDAQLALGIY